MRRFPSGPLVSVGQRIVLDAATSHHILRVTRVARGELVELFDGVRSCAARLVDVSDGDAVCELVDPPKTTPVAVRLGLALALLKGPAFDLSLRMATELGVTDIWPVHAKRSVVKGDKADRWMRIVEGAARQSGRAVVPTLHGAMPLNALLDAIPDGWAKVACAPIATASPPAGRPVVVFIGPEGGWTDKELAALVEGGATLSSLGAHVLRADTAVAAALALVGRTP